MKTILLLLALLGVHAKAQNVEKDQKLMMELGINADFSPKIPTPNPAFGFGMWYRYPIQNDARLELGGNIKTGSVMYQFDYGKNGTIYQVNSKVFVFNLGGRLVKEFRIKNQNIEWISELTVSNLFFDGTGIPDDPIREPENPNTTVIVIDAESVSTLQFGQGLRIWKKNIGFGIKTSFAPYRLWYKTTVPSQFNVFSAEASIAIKL